MTDRPRGPSRTVVLPGPATSATAAPSSTCVAALRTTPLRKRNGDPGGCARRLISPASDLRDGAAMGAAFRTEVLE